MPLAGARYNTCTSPAGDDWRPSHALAVRPVAAGPPRVISSSHPMPLATAYTWRPRCGPSTRLAHAARPPTHQSTSIPTSQSNRIRIRVHRPAPAAPAGPRQPSRVVAGGKLPKERSQRMATTTKPATIGQLRASGYRVLPVKEEMRKNLIRKMRDGEELFPGIVGYEDTVIPQVENAILSGQDIVLLGERGQAKTRIARSLVNLLDEEVPAVVGCEINDDPFAPICKACQVRIAEEGDDTPIHWVPRDRRYGEKLATPDITIADLVGEVDPIKVAEGRYLSDELTIHFGLIPRTHRGIFAINELPDLAERIQVGLLNIMEERDVQIRGYRLRLPLDVYVVATANPEDYTNRGRIITPLKDRFGAQVRTHYPASVDLEIEIMEQERVSFETE